MHQDPQTDHLTVELVVAELQRSWTEHQTSRETHRLAATEAQHACNTVSRAISTALAWGMTTEDIAEVLGEQPSALRQLLPRKFSRRRGWHAAHQIGPGWFRYWNGSTYTKTYVPGSQPRVVDHKRATAAAGAVHLNPLLI